VWLQYEPEGGGGVWARGLVIFGVPAAAAGRIAVVQVSRVARRERKREEEGRE
jgi:hypothetical protein